MVERKSSSVKGSTTKNVKRVKKILRYDSLLIFFCESLFFWAWVLGPEPIYYFSSEANVGQSNSAESVPCARFPSSAVFFL